MHLRQPVSTTLLMSRNTSTIDESAFNSSKNARVTLMFDTPSRPLRPRNVEFLVFPHKMDEVLLSHLLLQIMGFDFFYRISHQFEISITMLIYLHYVHLHTVSPK